LMCATNRAAGNLVRLNPLGFASFSLQRVFICFECINMLK
jgi:hypothetical protein